jgi:hypothetical protein
VKRRDIVTRILRLDKRDQSSKQVGGADHLKVFVNVDAAEKWFEESDPEDVAFEYEVLG